MRKGAGSSCPTYSKWDFGFYLCVSREKQSSNLLLLCGLGFTFLEVGFLILAIEGFWV